MTILDLIKASMRIALGSTETPSAEESADALQALQLLLGELQNDPLLSIIERQSFSTVASTASYAIEDGGDEWDGNTPIKIREAYIVDSSGYENLLDELSPREFADITDKTSPGLPVHFYYENGTVYLYPCPDDAYTVKIVSLGSIMTAASTSETITLTKSYIQMLKYGLAVAIATEFGVEVKPIVLSQYQQAKLAIQRTNLRKPAEVTFEMFAGDGFYDIETDRIR